jgi:hypothetical protein
MGATPIPGRMTADATEGVTVFLIGMRINNFRALRSWWPVFRAMPRMLRELSQDQGSGLLGYRLRLGSPRDFEVIQYWESPEKLLGYAAAPERQHRPAWAAFNRHARAGRGHVGIWHETYVVPAGGHECIYADMPPYGLAAATAVVPVARRGEQAAERLAAR